MPAGIGSNQRSDPRVGFGMALRGQVPGRFLLARDRYVYLEQPRREKGAVVNSLVGGIGRMWQRCHGDKYSASCRESGDLAWAVEFHGSW